MLFRNKKGVSIMVGYVLLIVIAVALSAGVYSFLKAYLPDDNPKCHEDVSIAIENVVCSEGNLVFTIKNQGLFSIDGAYFRIGEPGRIAKDNLNDDNFLFYNENGQFDLKPGEVYQAEFPYAELGVREAEVQAVMFVEDEYSLCSNAIVAKEVTC